MRSRIPPTARAVAAAAAAALALAAPAGTGSAGLAPLPTSAPEGGTCDAGPVPNDCVADAFALGALPYTNAQTTVGATLEAGEVPACGVSPMDATVWYRWTAPADATVTAETVGSGFDTVLAVRRNVLPSVAIPEACNDDIDYPGNLQSRVTFAAAAGTTYELQVGGYLHLYPPVGEQGSLVLAVR